jgi:hypothetical protein
MKKTLHLDSQLLLLEKSQLRWFLDVLRMPEERAVRMSQIDNPAGKRS